MLSRRIQLCCLSASLLLMNYVLVEKEGVTSVYADSYSELK